jgi:hypothetical protein
MFLMLQGSLLGTPLNKRERKTSRMKKDWMLAFSAVQNESETIE